jgi:hypothetical protein
VNVIFKKQASIDYQARQTKRRRERVGVLVIIGLVFYFVGAAEAILLSVAMAVYALSEIDANLSYANFLKEHELGLHDLDD